MPSSRELARCFLLGHKYGCPEQQLRFFRTTNYHPHPKQWEFHLAARECDAEDGPNQVGFGGARGPGKSHASFAQIALDDCRRQPGLKALYLRKIGKQAKEQFEDLRRAVLKKVPHYYDKRTGVVQLWRDSRIYLGHFKAESDIDNYLGIEYDAILIEEATTLTASKYKALRDSNRTSKQFRPRVYTTTNPGNIGHRWYKARFVTPWVMEEQENTRFVPATVDDNPLLDLDYKQKLEENVGWKLRAHRYGDWDIAAGQYFEDFSVERHVITPFRLPDDSDFWLAMDYGWTHPTVFLLFGRDGDGNVFIMDEYLRAKGHVKNHAAAVKRMLRKWNLSEKLLNRVPAGHDVFNKSEEKTIADKYRAHGISLMHANNDRVTGAAEVTNRLGSEEFEVKPTIFIFKGCRNLIECLPVLQHDPNHPDDVKKYHFIEDEEIGDDTYDALRYGLMSRPIVRPSFMSGPARDVIADANKYRF